MGRETELLPFARARTRWCPESAAGAGTAGFVPKVLPFSAAGRSAAIFNFARQMELINYK